MSFDWKYYVHLAEELLKQNNEAHLRACISRAYYGVFCIARDKKGFVNYRPKPGENIHQIIINKYTNSYDVKEQTIGLSLDELRRSRNQADYRGAATIKPDLAERRLTSAKEILKNLGITY